MNFLPTKAIDEIKAHDSATWRGMNRTRFYKYLLPAGSDMEIHAVAVKANKKKQLFVKEVVRASVDDPWMYLKDISVSGVCGYMVDWSPEGIGNKQYWAYEGRWMSELYNYSSPIWKLSSRPVINPNALLKHDRFRYCAWTPGCGDILDFLKIYAKHPRIELLAKLDGAARFATRVGFVRQLERDKDLMRFFIDELSSINDCGYGIDVIRLAYKRGCTLANAAARIADRRKFRGCGLPRAIDATRALEYIRRQNTREYVYCKYLADCNKLGLDLSDTKNAFPRRFKKRAAIVKDQADEIEIRKKAELTQKMDAQLFAIAAKVKQIERTRSKSFKVVVPRSSADFIREGKRLKNCLGDGHYAAKMAREETLVAFIRKSSSPNSSFVAAEYDLRQKRVMQCYSANNSKPEKPVFDFVNRIFRQIGQTPHQSKKLRNSR